MKASDHSELAGTANRAPFCPECKSSSVTTTSKHPDVDSYWRCERCGEVWNVSRRRQPFSRGSVRW